MPSPESANYKLIDLFIKRQRINPTQKSNRNNSYIKYNVTNVKFIFSYFPFNQKKKKKEEIFHITSQNTQHSMKAYIPLKGLLEQRKKKKTYESLFN